MFQKLIKIGAGGWLTNVILQTETTIQKSILCLQGNTHQN